MNRWRVTYDNGAVVEILARSGKDAIIEANEQAARDGHGGLRAVSAEWIR